MIKPQFCGGPKISKGKAVERSDFIEQYDFCFSGNTLELKLLTTIYTLTNSHRFDPLASGDPLTAEAVLTGYETPMRPQRYSYDVRKTVLERDDNIYVSIPALTTSSTEFFTIVETG